ncbi:MAG: SET domain-containing protein-lysine N-methyltransferase [Waddliaceae bacterium]
MSILLQSMWPFHKKETLFSNQPFLEGDLAHINMEETDPYGFTLFELAHFLGALPKKKREIEGVSYFSHPRFLNYAQFQHVIAKSPWFIRKTFLGDEMRALAIKYQAELKEGWIANVEVKWISEDLGFGLFAGEDLPKQAYIGEYTGHVQKYNPYQQINTAYCIAYPKMPWTLQGYLINAEKGGNETRFINHNHEPNLEVTAVCDRGLMRTVFFANQTVHKGEQLTFDYGNDYWRNRKETSI